MGLAVIHKGLAEYVQALSHHLEEVVEQIETPSEEEHDRWSSSVQQPVRLRASR